MMKTVALRKYFWDTDFETLDFERHKTYVAERLLELGDEEAAKWLLEQFSKSDLAAIVSRSKVISPKSRAFWNLILKQ